DAIPLPAFSSADPSGIPVPDEYIPEGKLEEGDAHDTKFLGLDPQPFLVEVFIGHVYKPSITVPDLHVPEGEGVECEVLEFVDPNDYDDFGIVPYANAGERAIIDDPDSRSAIVVVQIANPFDVPLDLWQYRIEVGGETEPQVFELTSLPSEKRYLHPATEE